MELGGASVLHGDNTASIDAARHPGKHRSALRHLELHAFAVRDLIREEQVRLQWVDTKSNPADLLTKAVPSKALFDKFAKLIMGAVDDTAHCEGVSFEFEVGVSQRTEAHVTLGHCACTIRRPVASAIWSEGVSVCGGSWQPK